MALKHKPVLLAMVLCDLTIREQETQKLSLIGTFNGLFAGKFPCIHPSLSVYVALTGGRGVVPCALDMTSLRTGNSIFSLPGKVEFKDPIMVSEMVLQIQQIRFEEPGDYAIDFFADGEMLCSRKLRVQQAPLH